MCVFACAGGGELQIITKSQTLRLSGGNNVLLPCEFLISRFDIFDNPVIWRKIQMDEDVEININSVMLEPFQDTHRFDATSSVDGNNDVERINNEIRYVWLNCFNPRKEWSSMAVECTATKGRTCIHMLSTADKVAVLDQPVLIRTVVLYLKFIFFHFRLKADKIFWKMKNTTPTNYLTLLSN
ncbi:hypothetical protein HELRODRAFT_184116 [Helobdella robusta]|uniref:Uncharacterized protein n=1 Tax=Helobdella robusta TaxID=6412 RepID=T1FKL9_HELRO|nr:hypothetical protein HELRODRAFT_184116 [Helobdella robusta]ESO07836.1 hypothetical protein HELRODRAFT_184116 [Helobdella robusta]